MTGSSSTWPSAPGCDWTALDFLARTVIDGDAANKEDWQLVRNPDAATFWEWSYGSVSERGDLLELVCDAYGRLPTMSANVHTWTHMERNERAMDVACQRFNGGPASGLYSRHQGGLTEFDSWERLVIDPRRGAFRVEHGDSWSRTQAFVSDGETTWTRNFLGDVIADSDGPRHVPSSAFDLLDPSWLADFDSRSYTRDRHNVRDILRMRTGVSSVKVVVQSRMNIYATDVEVIIDARLGFLHRLIQFVDGQPFQRVELGDIVLDPVLDPNVFQFDRRVHPYRRIPSSRTGWA
jgi:hypothetical protein